MEELALTADPSTVGEIAPRLLNTDYLNKTHYGATTMSNTTNKGLTAATVKSGGEKLMAQYSEQPSAVIPFAATMGMQLADTHRVAELAAMSMMFAVASKIPGELRCEDEPDGTVRVYKGRWPLIGTYNGRICTDDKVGFVCNSSFRLTRFGSAIFQSNTAIMAEYGFELGNN